MEDVGWVKICPFVEVNAPHPLLADQDPSAKDVKEIYNFFQEEDHMNPMAKFMEHYNSLAHIPNPGQSKLQQVLHSIRLIKMARQAKLSEKHMKKSLKQMGIKI